MAGAVGASHVPHAPGPIRVMLVEEADLPGLPDLLAGRTEPEGGSRVEPDDGSRSDGRAYHSALVFVARDGCLVGQVEVPLGLASAGLASAGSSALAVLYEPSDSHGHPAGPSPALGQDPPLVSVVVATTMVRTRELDRCLAALLALDYPDFEVIIVDNRPDGSAARAALHVRLSADPRVRVVVEPRPGISAARNHGTRVARGDLVAFTDDDAVVHRGWLRGLARRFVAEPDVGCVSGVVLPAELDTPAQIWFERSGSKLALRYQPVRFGNDGGWRGAWLGGLRRARFEVTATTADGRVDRQLVYRAGTFGMGANIAFRRTALHALGGFDETLGTGTAARGAEDIAAIARLLHGGGRVVMDPAAIVHHYHRPDYVDARRQMYAYGVGATAALTALVRADPAHLVGLLHLARPGLAVLRGRSARRRASGYPRQLAMAELYGMLVGPFAYVRSVLAHDRGSRG